MKAVVALFAFCALFTVSTERAQAQDDKAPRAPALVAPGGGTASPPPSAPLSRDRSKAPAEGFHQKEDAGDEEDAGNIVAPEHDEAPTASEPYTRDPYETEPSEEEAGAGDDEGPELDEPSAVGAQEPDDPRVVDEYDTGPDDAAGD